MASLTALKSRRRHDYAFALAYRTRWSDNDMYAHLNNSVYQHLIDSVVNTYLITHCGLTPGSSSPASANAKDQIGLVVHSHLDYFAPLSFPGMVDACLSVTSLGKASVTYEIGLFAEGDDAPAAVGGFVHVFVDKASRKVEGAMGSGLKDGLGKLVRGKGKL